VPLSIKIDPKLAVLFMTTAKHSRCAFRLWLAAWRESI
jgi:hypothetical protein